MDKYTVTFPPFGGDNQLSLVCYGFHMFYYNGYIQKYTTTSGEKVGIHIGFYKYAKSWYINCFKDLGISKTAHIYITGVSLGGGLTNTAAYILLQAGYKNVHFYAFGAPRVGDQSFRNYMNASKFAEDSANYVRFNNVVKTDRFYSQFDPVCKFPPNEITSWGAAGYSLRYVDNPRLKIMAAGLTFNPVFKTYFNQPDYNFINPGSRLSKQTPIGAECGEYFELVHSMGSYDYNIFLGSNVDVGGGKKPRYEDRYDAILDLNTDPCTKKDSCPNYQGLIAGSGKSLVFGSSTGVTIYGAGSTAPTAQISLANGHITGGVAAGLGAGVSYGKRYE